MAEVATRPEAFRARLESVLIDGLKARGIDATVKTEAVRLTPLHRALVVSPQFEEMSHSERQSIVWDAVRDGMGREEQLGISMILALTPDEVGDDE